MTLTQDQLTSDPVEKKRLGQYFTGLPLAKLLASLSDPTAAASIIDPMVGSGDMLLACLELGANPDRVEGWDLDPRAVTVAARRLHDSETPSELRIGSAFELAEDFTTYDLVITNPPYVRYQSTSASGGIEFRIPSAEATRASLRRSIALSETLRPDVRTFLLRLTDSYSGLSDLAVPSWILCAALTKPGGTLAMLVPQSWMNRDYAAPIRALLGTLFDVEFLVEDQSGTWFDEASIRTGFVIAKRKSDDVLSESIWSEHDGGFVHARIASEARDGSGLVGTFGSVQEFARQMRSALSDHTSFTAPGIDASFVPGFADSDTAPSSLSSLPQAIRRLLPSAPVDFVSLRDLGWNVGQGLRTGANEFFYAEQNADGSVVALPRLHPTVVHPPEGTSLLAVRRQSDLPDGYCLSTVRSQSRLLFLEGWSKLPSGATPSIGSSELDSAFTSLLDEAESIEFPPGSGKTIPELTAVVTNVRSASNTDEERGARYWYQLPALKERHRPDLIIPRVCGGRPRVYRNPGRRLVVDANFSSLWSESADALDSFAVLAILNSDYVSAMLELQAHVLGGGALKVEASHVRGLLFPRFLPEQMADLAAFGRALCAEEGADAKTLDQINAVLADALNPGNPTSTSSALRDIADSARTRRA